jgi:hypothetical protein
MISRNENKLNARRKIFSNSLKVNDMTGTAAQPYNSGYLRDRSGGL